LLQPLDPTKDERLVNFYYDFYNWTNSNLIQNIDSNSAFKMFPAQVDMTNLKSLMILIAGYNNSGRESLRNLIIHKIRCQAGNAPLLVEVDIPDRNHADNIKMIARSFNRAYKTAALAAPSYEDLKTLYDEETAGRATGVDSFYSSLFQAIQTAIRGHCAVPVVLIVTGVNDYEVWRAIHNSTRYLFQFTIVLSSDVLNARTCNNLMKTDGRNVVLIESPKLGLASATNYLKNRLKSERIDKNNPVTNNQLGPFTTKALEALFAPSESAKETEQIEWEIGWLNRRLQAALDDHLTALQKIVDLNGEKVLATLNPQELLIDDHKIKATIERVNQNK